MEKYLKFLITLSTVTAILLVIIVIAVFIHYLRTRAKAGNMLKSKKRGGSFVYDLLATSFRRDRILRSVKLPEFLPDGTYRPVPADIILVDRGGVFIIRVKNVSGNIDNPKNDNWMVYSANGEQQLIVNPFEQNKRTVHAVEAILKRENVYNVPLYNIVVFSGNRVKFKYRYEKLTTSDQVIDLLRDFNRNKFLSQSEIGNTVSAIKKYIPKKRAEEQQTVNR